MKAVLPLVALSMIALMLAGCATPYPVGALYTDVQLPMDATSNKGAATKIGSAECMSVLALISIGDASIEAAKRNGGITEVHHVDWEAKNILGIIGKYRVVVHGQ